MVEKKINQTVVLAVHKHGNARLLYLEKKLDKIIPKDAQLIECVIYKVIA